MKLALNIFLKVLFLAALAAGSWYFITDHTFTVRRNQALWEGAPPELTSSMPDTDSPTGYIDVDHDGILDAVVLHAKVIFFARGLGNDQFAPWVPIRVFTPNLVAGNISEENGVFTITTWDKHYRAWKSRLLCLDTSGTPKFSDPVEEDIRPY